SCVFQNTALDGGSFGVARRGLAKVFDRGKRSVRIAALGQDAGQAYIRTNVSGPELYCLPIGLGGPVSVGGGEAFSLLIYQFGRVVGFCERDLYLALLNG